MSKLPSYGITARALQILLETREPVSQIPSAWFNWVGVTPTGLTLHSAFSPQRLSIVCADKDDPRSAARWCANSLEAGYHCVFIDAVDDDHCVDDLGLEDGIGYSVIAPTDEGRNSNQATVTELREPDRKVAIYWDSVRQGGGAMIEKMGFADVTAAQWRVYGQFLEEWIEQTKDEKAPDVRIETPDFSKWNPWEHLGGEGRILSLSEHFNTPPSSAWPWNVENPLTAKQIPNLGSDVEAFWPMRQMPFCGVVRTAKGILKAVGALPDKLDARGNWLWDDGSIRAAFLATSKVKESLLAKIKRLFGNENAEVSSWSFPSQAYADSGDEGGIHRLDNGERIEIIWNEDFIKISHTRSLGGTHDLWLSAITATSDGEVLLGCWKYSEFVEKYSPGISRQHLAQSITFVVTDFEVKGI